MRYSDTGQDKKLREKFQNDYKHAFLRKIHLTHGELRGINSLEIQFEYPITAIAGKNGAGKSTILALACCAYHNRKTGFQLPKRKLPYYTFSDFFLQHHEEVPPQGISIHYSIAYDNWKKSEKFPEGIGIGFQRRWKKQGGKWNDYDDRIKRNVVFLGIDRIVPPSERSQSRSYARAFRDSTPMGWEGKVKDAVGYILGKSYDQFRYLRYSKYALPIVKTGDIIYSGFNMGAGENALFEIFSVIYSCGSGALIVLDEIEIGLHAEAQKKLIEILKGVCLETNTQIVCTTHSKEIFDFLPYYARYFVESVNGNTKITGSISSDFAFAKMAAVHGKEIDILVEDEVAKLLLQAILPASIRSRISIKSIGSATALSRQLAATYVRGEERAILAIFDGDQRAKQNDNLQHAENMAENVEGDFKGWCLARIAYLPGDSWPEAWIVSKSQDCLARISTLVSSEEGELADILESGLRAGKHREFYEIASKLGLEQEQCLQFFAVAISQNFPNEFDYLITQISNILSP